MRFLFLHPNFPSQHGAFASHLGSKDGNEVVFLTNTTAGGQLPGVRKVVYQLARKPHNNTHPYLRGMESAVLHGQAALRVALQLRKAGWLPDVVFGHSGWGSTLFMKEAFPNRPLLCNFEWFYHARGTDSDFDPSEPLTLDTEASIRCKNASLLLDLTASAGGICPMPWQLAQFPKEFHPKLTVLHEGIDCGFFAPRVRAPLVLPRAGIDLTAVPRIVTYVSRGFEPYRGFLQVMEGMALVLERYPDVHVVLAGDDRSAYGKRPPGGKTWKQVALEKFSPDPGRIHFTGLLTRAEYRSLLFASSAHIYFTRPFVLSWSLLESMAAGCAVVASRTAPVQEVVEHQRNGWLVDFFQPAGLADAVGNLLDDPALAKAMGQEAASMVRQNFHIGQLWPQRERWLKSFA